MATACSSVPHYPEATYEISRGAVTVRGEHESDVRTIAALIAALSPMIKDRLESECSAPVRAALLDDMPIRARGMTVTRRDADQRIVERFILIKRLPPQRYPGVVAHELVHWYAVDVWERLPTLLEEGLADHVACEVAPAIASEKQKSAARLAQRVAGLDVRGALRMSQADFETLSPDDREAYYALGRQLVERIGVDDLRALATQARDACLPVIPTEWILDRSTAPQFPPP